MWEVLIKRLEQFQRSTNRPARITLTDDSLLSSRFLLMNRWWFRQYPCVCWHSNLEYSKQIIYDDLSKWNEDWHNSGQAEFYNSAARRSSWGWGVTPIDMTHGKVSCWAVCTEIFLNLNLVYWWSIELDLSELNSSIWTGRTGCMKNELMLTRQTKIQGAVHMRIVLVC